LSFAVAPVPCTSSTGASFDPASDCSEHPSALSSSALGTAPPVGLAGELRMRSRVRAVISASVSSAEKANWFSSRIGTGTGRAPVNSIMER